MDTIKVVTLNLAPRRFFHFRSAFYYQSLAIKSFIEWNKPDIILTQDLKDWMLPYLDFISKDYAFYGRSHNGKHKNSDYRNCVMFFKSKFSFIKGSNIPLKSSCMTCVQLELNKTHQSILFCTTHFKNMYDSKQDAQIVFDTLNTIPPLTPIILGGNDPVYHKLDNTLSNLRFKTLPQEPISYLQDLIHRSSSQYRPKDCLYASHHFTLKDSHLIKSMYTGSFPSSSIPMWMEVSLPLKEI